MSVKLENSFYMWKSREEWGFFVCFFVLWFCVGLVLVFG